MKENGFIICLFEDFISIFPYITEKGKRFFKSFGSQKCMINTAKGTKWATSNKFIAPAQNTINPAWAT
jgi:hypothetical protein